MHFIDIHSHVLPYLDDGAKDWTVALQMLKQAKDDGIRDIVCTPHILSFQDFAKEATIIERFEELVAKAKKAGLDLKLHVGSEIYVQPQLNLDTRIATLAGNGRYFLVEFPMNMIPDFVAQRFFNLIIAGKVPVIAHPERNARVINQLGIAYDFVQRGALLQMNAGSILGVFGEAVRETAQKLLDANLIHVVGSDAHDTQSRPIKLRQAYEKIGNGWGQERAHRLFFETASAILDGQPITVPEPIPAQVLSDSIGKKIRRALEKLR